MNIVLMIKLVYKGVVIHHADLEPVDLKHCAELTIIKLNVSVHKNIKVIHTSNAILNKEENANKIQIVNLMKFVKILFALLLLGVDPIHSVVLEKFVKAESAFWVAEGTQIVHSTRLVLTAGVLILVTFKIVVDVMLIVGRLFIVPTVLVNLVSKEIHMIIAKKLRVNWCNV